MKRIYTCFVCGFSFAVEEDQVPQPCPSYNSSKENYLSEPWNGSIEGKRIHVDFPKPDPNWDKMNISYHHPKQFPAHTRHGRVRRFVLPYGVEKLEQTRTFYGDVMNWDMYDTKHFAPTHPLIFCATSPENANWEPKFASFSYGFQKPERMMKPAPTPDLLLRSTTLKKRWKK